MRVKSKTLARRHSLPIIPAIVLAGGGLSPAHALELGEIKVQSHLGQPLRASIAYALAANEVIADYCVSLATAPSVNGMPALNNARISVANGVISLTGSTPLREPLVAARLSVQCPYTPNIARDYMLFVDPAPTAGEPTTVVTQPAARQPETRQPAARAATAAPVATRRPVPQAAPAQAAPKAAASSAKPTIVTGSRYRVQPGDSLSDIASRLEGRQVGLWQAVNAIFAANPQAFIDNDPNRLKAGSLLTIPLGTALGEVGTQFANEPEARSATSVSTAASDDTAYLEPAGVSTQAAVDGSLNAENPFAGNSVDTVIDPSVVSAEASGNAGSAAVATPITPITQAPAPAPAAETIERSTQGRTSDTLSTRIEAPASDTGVVWWTLGGALALITGLFFFRRRRQPVDPVPAPVADRPAPHPRDRYAEEDSIEVEVISAPGSEYGESIDFDLSDDSPTEENPALDADLVAGSGLSGEAATTGDELDFDFDAQANLEDKGDTAETDILPPPQRTASILESEVLPEEDEDEYDMSVIVDATKMPRPEDATQRDFGAVVVDEGDSVEDEESYTLSQEIDYQILEQDYEDELTATQALNKEIERAARELEHSMHDDEPAEAEAADTVESKTLADETLANDETTALPLASVTELDLTANMPAGNDDDSEIAADATGLTEELTARLPLEDVTQELPAQDDTAEVTAKLRVEGGKRGG